MTFIIDKASVQRRVEILICRITMNIVTDLQDRL